MSRPENKSTSGKHACQLIIAKHIFQHKHTVAAGSYSISIADSKSQDRLPGKPITYMATTGLPVAWQSSARFGKSLGKEGVIMAGAPLEIAVALKDKHGNASPGEP